MLGKKWDDESHAENRQCWEYEVNEYVKASKDQCNIDKDYWQNDQSNGESHSEEWATEVIEYAAENLKCSV